MDKEALDSFVQKNQEMLAEVSDETIQAVAIMTEMEDIIEYCNDAKKHRAIGKEKRSMCKAWEEIKADQRKMGMEQGIQQGILILIRDNMEDGHTQEKIVDKLQRFYSLNREESIRYIEGEMAAASV